MSIFLPTNSYFRDPELPVALFRRDHGIACLPHYHDFHEIVFVLRGRAVHVVDGYQHDFGAGDVLLIRGGQMHYYRQVQALSLVCLLIAPDFDTRISGATRAIQDFQRIFFSNATGGHPQARLTPGGREFRELLAYLAALEIEFLRLPEGRLPFLEHFEILLKLMAGLFSQALVGGSNYTKISRFEYSEYRLLPALKHLEQQFAQTVSLDDLIDLTAMPKRTLIRQFQRITGRSPVVYLHDLRLHYAMLELKRTAKRITDVALDVGFNDLSFFNRKFKSLAGRSPTIWRRQQPHAW